MSDHHTDGDGHRRLDLSARNHQVAYVPPAMYDEEQHLGELSDLSALVRAQAARIEELEDAVASANSAYSQQDVRIRELESLLAAHGLHVAQQNGAHVKESQPQSGSEQQQQQWQYELPLQHPRYGEGEKNGTWGGAEPDATSMGTSDSIAATSRGNGLVEVPVTSFTPRGRLNSPPVSAPPPALALLRAQELAAAAAAAASGDRLFSPRTAVSSASATSFGAAPSVLSTSRGGAAGRGCGFSASLSPCRGSSDPQLSVQELHSSQLHSVRMNQQLPKSPTSRAAPPPPVNAACSGSDSNVNGYFRQGPGYSYLPSSTRALSRQHLPGAGCAASGQGRSILLSPGGSMRTAPPVAPPVAYGGSMHVAPVTITEPTTPTTQSRGGSMLVVGGNATSSVPLRQRVAKLQMPPQRYQPQQPQISVQPPVSPCASSLRGTPMVSARSVAMPEAVQADPSVALLWSMGSPPSLAHTPRTDNRALQSLSSAAREKQGQLAAKTPEPGGSEADRGSPSPATPKVQAQERARPARAAARPTSETVE
eukprot:TRINITY_DN25987_c0_g1_i2.p1 TRINITY_DN25987_c0_g1~~TRINITY_DN25987_c0_g1_i2.p1  ORF type:complete len:538 (+),score=98.67 TRINITY_DN25987_c0_g1_i2:54-1667(+)